MHSNGCSAMAFLLVIQAAMALLVSFSKAEVESPGFLLLLAEALWQDMQSKDSLTSD